MKDTQTFTLEEIAALAELPRRTARYYIQSGLIDRPPGVATGALYALRHAEQLRLVRKWHLAGLSLQRIRALLKQRATAPLPRRAGTVEAWSHLVVAEGIEITLEPSRAGLTPEQVRAFLRAVTQAYAQIVDSEEKA